MTGRSCAVFALIVVPATLLLAGCSDNKKSFVLKGSVSYQGKPLSSGVVRLHMADNRMSRGMIQPDGSFTATDVFPGEAKVTVEEDMTAKMHRMMPPPAGGPQAPAPKAVSAPSSPIPAKYQDVNTTDLVFPLKAGTPLNIELR